MIIKDLNPNASEDIADVNIRPGDTTDIAILESNNHMALIMAVYTAMSNANVQFVSGTDTTVTLQIVNK